MKLNQSELEELIKFTFSKTYNPPKVVLTRGGSPVIIFLQEAKELHQY